MRKTTPDKSIIAARTEQALLDRIPVDEKTLRIIRKVLEPQNLKRIGIAAVGGSVLVSLVSSLGRDGVNRALTAKEIKKQLAPLQKKLEVLEEELILLSKQNEELKAQLGKFYSETRN